MFTEAEGKVIVVENTLGNDQHGDHQLCISCFAPTMPSLNGDLHGSSDGWNE